MLEEKRCGLCQSPAPEGSPQYDHIKKRKEQQEKYISNNLEFQHEDEIKLLKDEAFHFIKNAGKVDKDFQDYLQKIAELEDSIEEYKESLSKIKEDINQHLKSYDVDISNVEELLRKREKFDNELKYLNNQKGDKKGKIEEQQQELKKINYQIQMKSPKEVSEKLEIENELAKDLNDICNSSKEREYKRLLQHLEEQANSYFEKINKGSGAFFGKIKIRETNKGYSPIIENEYHQNVTKRVSTSIRQSLKISMIMAISSLNNDLNNRYPTISDAATSNFDDMKMLNYYVQTANAFNQSIVITKDFINQDNGKGWYFNQEQFDNLKENLNQNLGNVYLLKIPEEVDINKEEQILVKKEKIY
jgi:DNA repair exonuclease SbcCD ATPase subunit